MKASKRPEHLWVGINGKASGYHALKEAISIARWLHASVTTVAVAPLYEGDLGLTGVGSVRKNLYKDIETSLSHALEIAEELRYPVRIAAAGGDVCDQLLEKASASRQTGWIVIGAGQSFSALRWLAGTPLLSIPTHSSLPVLIVPEKAAVSGEVVWLDLGRIQRDVGWAAHLAKWLEASLQIAAWFGVDRLMLARPEDFPDRHLLRNILSAWQEKRVLPDASEREALLSIEVVDFPYRNTQEVFPVMESDPPALLLIPSPGRRTFYDGAPHSNLAVRMKSNWGRPFDQRALSNGIIRFPGKCRFSLAAWHAEKRIRALPCPALVLTESV